MLVTEARPGTGPTLLQLPLYLDHTLPLPVTTNLGDIVIFLVVL